MANLSQETENQIARLSIDRDRPMLVCDADEVLVQFVIPLTGYFDERGYSLELVNYRLDNSVRCKESGAVVERDKVWALIDDFFHDRVDHCPPVEGAVDAMRRLSEHVQLLVLSNVPAHAHKGRQKSLIKHGIDVPLISNTGPKGPAIRHISRLLNAPLFFVDDVPFQLNSARQYCDSVEIIHFVADARLRSMLDPPENAHTATSWRDIEDTVLRLIGA